MKKQIKTFEEACKALKIEAVLPDVSMIPEKEQKAIIAHYKLTVIARALNEGWFPDWDNDDEYKYYPWFNMDDSGAPLGFSFNAYDYDYTGTSVGARLCYKSSELARYAGKTFEDLYREYMVIEK